MDIYATRYFTLQNKGYSHIWRLSKILSFPFPILCFVFWPKWFARLSLAMVKKKDEKKTILL